MTADRATGSSLVADMPAPLTIGAVLNDVSAALGDAARTIVDRSSTEVGTLAVKTAQLTVDFDISSSSSTEGAGGGLRLRPGSVRVSGDAHNAQSNWSNHATLTLEIVSVLPDTPTAATTPRPDAGGTTSDVGNVVGIVLPPGLSSGEDLARRLRDLFRGLQPEQAIEAQKELDTVRQAVDGGDLDAAKRLFATFTRRWLPDIP